MPSSTLPTHHLEDEWLLAYVAGSCSETQALLAAAHLTLCPPCRARSAHLESVAAALMFEAEPELSLTAPPTSSPEMTNETRAQEDPLRSLPSDLKGVPRPVLQRLKDSRWRFYGPGVQHIEVDAQWNGIPSRLFKLAAGSTVPHHSHKATELLMVFSGGYDDKSGTYVRGDVQICGPEVVHSLAVHAGEPCIALVGYEDRLVPKTLRGRLFSLLRGI